MGAGLVRGLIRAGFSLPQSFQVAFAEEAEGHFDGFGVLLDEGVVGVDDAEVAHAVDAAAFAGDDAVVVGAEDAFEEGDSAFVSHDDGAFEVGGEAGESGGGAVGSEVAACGAEEGVDDGVFGGPVDDFAALVGRGEEDGASGEPGWGIGEHGAEEDAAEGVGDEVDAMVFGEADDLGADAVEDGVEGEAG